eukprot:553155-Hanusia_phi.AAC.4
MKCTPPSVFHPPVSYPLPRVVTKKTVMTVSTMSVTLRIWIRVEMRARGEMAGEWQAGMVAGYHGGETGGNGRRMKKVTIIASVESQHHSDGDDSVLVEWNGKRKQLKSSLLFRINDQETSLSEKLNACRKNSVLTSSWLDEVIKASGKITGSSTKGESIGTHCVHSHLNPDLHEDLYTISHEAQSSKLRAFNIGSRIPLFQIDMKEARKKRVQQRHSTNITLVKRRQKVFPRDSIVSHENSPSQSIAVKLDEALESCFSPTPGAPKRSDPSHTSVSSSNATKDCVISTHIPTQHSELCQLVSTSVSNKDMSCRISDDVNQRSAKFQRNQYHLNQSVDSVSSKPISTKECSKKDKECLKLVKKIVNDQTKEKVDLRGRFFDIKQLRNVFEALVSNKSCTCLDLRLCMIRNDGFKELYKSLLQHGSNLRWIDLAQNDLTDNIIPDLLESMKSSPFIRYIDLRSNKISYQAATDMKRFLTQFPRNAEGKRRKIELDESVLEGQVEDVSMSEESDDSQSGLDLGENSSNADDFVEELHENGCQERDYDMSHCGMLCDDRNDNEDGMQISPFFLPRHSLNQNSDVSESALHSKNHLQVPKFKKSNDGAGKGLKKLKLTKTPLSHDSQRGPKHRKYPSGSPGSDAWLSLWEKKCSKKLGKRSKKRFSTSGKAAGSNNSFPTAYGVGSLVPHAKRPSDSRSQPIVNLNAVHEEHSQVSTKDDFADASKIDGRQAIQIQVNQESSINATSRSRFP